MADTAGRNICRRETREFIGVTARPGRLKDHAALPFLGDQHRRGPRSHRLLSPLKLADHHAADLHKHPTTPKEHHMTDYDVTGSTVALLRASVLDDDEGITAIFLDESTDALLGALLTLAEALGVTATGSKEALVAVLNDWLQERDGA